MALALVAQLASSRSRAAKEAAHTRSNRNVFVEQSDD